jgi:hypothetical protein
VHKVTPILISLLLANMPSAVTPPFSRRVDGTFNAVQAFRRASRTCMRPCTALVKCDESIAPHTRRGGRMTNRRDYHKRPGNDARSRGRYVSLMEYMLASAAWQALDGNCSSTSSWRRLKPQNFRPSGNLHARESRGEPARKSTRQRARGALSHDGRGHPAREHFRIAAYLGGSR